MREGFSLHIGRRTLDTGLLRPIENTLREKGVEGLICVAHTTVTPDVNDRTADVLVLGNGDPSIKTLHPYVLIDIIEHRDLWRTKKKHIELWHRFPKAEFFILEFANRKKDRIETALKWYKLMDGKFEEGNNHCTLIGGELNPNESSMEDLSFFMNRLDKQYQIYVRNGKQWPMEKDIKVLPNS